jgi:hypothetical protein
VSPPGGGVGQAVLLNHKVEGVLFEGQAVCALCHQRFGLLRRQLTIAMDAKAQAFGHRVHDRHFKSGGGQGHHRAREGIAQEQGPTAVAVQQAGPGSAAFLGEQHQGIRLILRQLPQKLLPGRTPGRTAVQQRGDAVQFTGFFQGPRPEIGGGHGRDVLGIR